LRLSIVIAAWNGIASLDRCLRSLQYDGRTADTEVLAVTNFDGGTREMLHGHFRWAQHVSMPPGTTVAQLRSAGIQRSTGEIVALAEDHCTFGKNWCAELIKAHELPFSVIGGAVENASVKRALDWAAYLYDYGNFMLPLTPGVVPALSGNNVSYKRAALEEVKESFEEGFFEPFTHRELMRRGHVLYLMPALVVHHEKTYKAKSVVVQAYHLARSFAGKRVLGVPLPRRVVFTIGSIALPLLLVARIVLRTLRKRRLVPQLMWSLPYLMLLTTSWSLGEFCGYFAGPGRSADEWK
jgi:hypothetical protein